MYPWWFLQPYAPATDLWEAVWVGTQAQVSQDQPAKTSYTLSLLYFEMNLILCLNNSVSSLWYPKTSTEPHSKTRT